MKSPWRAIASHLRLKTVVVMVVTIVILISVLHLAVNAIVQASFDKVESGEAMDKLTVAMNAVTTEMGDLGSSARDYAAWTDTYDFVKTHNSTYIEVNLINSTYENLRVQTIVVLDVGAFIVYGRSHYLYNETTVLPTGLTDHLYTWDSLMSYPLSGTAITGVLILTDGSWLVSSQPVLHSDGTGPVAGCLMFLRQLDEDERTMIEQSTLLDLTFYDPSDPSPVAVLGPALHAELMNGESVSLALNDSDYTAWGLLPNIHDEPGLIIRADLPRAAHAEYLSSSLVLSGALVVASCLFGVVTFFLIDRAFLIRINRLSDGVQSIGSKQNAEKRVRAKGEDEITKLAININSMLEGIESRDKELLDSEKRHGEQLELMVEDRTEELRLTNTELEKQVKETEAKDRELRRSEERYRAVVEDQVDMIVRMRLDGTVTFANRAFCTRFGITPDGIVGKKLEPGQFETSEVLLRTAARDLTMADPVRSQDFAVPDGRGSMRWENWLVRGVFDDQGNLVEIQSVGRDVTDRVKIDQEIMRTQKLESLGRMAAGIAHDYNNIMTSVVGNLTLAKMEKDPVRLQRRLGEMDGLIARAKTLSEQLLTFSEGGAPIKDRVDLAPLLKACCEVGVVSGAVHLKFAIDLDLWDVMADKGQMSQVFNNIVNNALDAMPDGGTLTVSASNLTLPDGRGDMPPGDYVELRFMDTGKGIKKEDLPRVLDPFFSTKPTGSGLGLSAALSIVRRHGGTIELSSEEDIGTDVTILLPAITALKEAKREAPKPFVRGKVLLMDDEEPILEVMTELMTYLGYDVDTARDGVEAIKRYQDSANRGAGYDVVIMDLTIPEGMGGKEAVLKLRELDPHALVVVSSGYSNDPVMSEPGKYGFDSVLQKPYTMEELRDKLAEVLSKRYT